MKPVYREEIHAFILASETLLSRVILVPPMTTEEKALVQTYVKELQARCEEDETLPKDTSPTGSRSEP